MEKPLRWRNGFLNGKAGASSDKSRFTKPLKPSSQQVIELDAPVAEVQPEEPPNQEVSAEMDMWCTWMKNVAKRENLWMRIRASTVSEIICKAKRAQLIAELDRRGLDPRQLTQYRLDKIVRDLPRVWEEDLSTEAELFGV